MYSLAEDAVCIVYWKMMLFVFNARECYLYSLEDILSVFNERVCFLYAIKKEWCFYSHTDNAVFILCKSLTTDKRCLYSSKGNFDSHKNRFSAICVHQRKCWLKELKKEMLRLFVLEVFIVKGI